MVAYADQTSDTTHLCSLDSWTISSTESWLTISPKEATFPAGQATDTKLTFEYEVNNTGAPRIAYAQVKSHDQIATTVTQYYWLHITRPQVMKLGEQTSGVTTETRVVFPMTLKKEAYTDSITFTVHQDNATLSTSASWIHPEETTFEAGKHTVKFNVEANTEGQSRSAILTLTSAGVSSDITLTQEK